MLVEDLAKPVVLVVTEEFARIASELARLRKHSALRTLVLPFPLEGRPDEEVRDIAASAYPQLVQLLGAKH